MRGWFLKIWKSLFRKSRNHLFETLKSHFHFFEKRFLKCKCVYDFLESRNRFPNFQKSFKRANETYFYLKNESSNPNPYVSLRLFSFPPQIRFGPLSPKYFFIVLRLMCSTSRELVHKIHCLLLDLK